MSLDKKLDYVDNGENSRHGDSPHKNHRIDHRNSSGISLKKIPSGSLRVMTRVTLIGASCFAAASALLLGHEGHLGISLWVFQYV